MKQMSWLLAALGMACAPGSGTLDSEPDGPGPDDPADDLVDDSAELDPQQDVLANLENSESFTILVEALVVSGLRDELLPENTPQMGWTLFAPTDAAFVASGVDPADYQTAAERSELANILQYHITHLGPMGFSSLVGGPDNPACTPYEGELPMNNGEYAVEGDYNSWTSFATIAGNCTDPVTIDEARIISVDNLVENSGMIQVIDAVLTP